MSTEDYRQPDHRDHPETQTGVTAPAPNASEDIFNSEEYEKFVLSMIPYCHCEGERPCDGVLAGGLCDGRREDRNSDIEQGEE